MTGHNVKSNLLNMVSLMLRIYLGGVFVMAAVFKIIDPRAFALSIATYDFLPLWAINLFALALPMVELFVGLTLILGLWTRESAFLISAMMVMFLIALGWALHQGIHMSCGCFASAEAEDAIGYHTIVRDLIWLAMDSYILLLDDGRFGLDRWIRRTTTEVPNHG